VAENRGLQKRDTQEESSQLARQLARASSCRASWRASWREQSTTGQSYWAPSSPPGRPRPAGQPLQRPQRRQLAQEARPRPACPRCTRRCQHHPQGGCTRPRGSPSRCTLCCHSHSRRTHSRVPRACLPWPLPRGQSRGGGVYHRTGGAGGGSPLGGGAPGACLGEGREELLTGEGRHYSAPFGPGLPSQRWGRDGLQPGVGGWGAWQEATHIGPQASLADY